MGVSNVIKFRSHLKACSGCSLNKLCLPQGIEEDYLEVIEQIVDTVGPLHKGDYLFRQGDSFKHLYAVRSGYVKTSLTTESGEEQVLGFYMPGEILALDSIHAERKRCSAQVLNTSMVCRLPFDKLCEICQKFPTVQRQLMRMMSREIVMSESLSTTHTADQKMAAFLFNWGQRMASQGFSPRHFLLPMTRQDIGNYLRIAPETVSRCLTAFVQRGWLITFRREIQITEKFEEDLQIQCG